MTDRRLTSQTFLWLSLTAYGVAFLVGTVVGAVGLIVGFMVAAWEALGDLVEAALRRRE